MHITYHKDTGKVSVIHHKTPKNIKDNMVKVAKLPEFEKDIEKYNGQLYYDKDENKLYYEYSEREDDELDIH